ncbi:MAG: peptidyl-prolyl cis-trans isomerase [Bacteroidia bacterium]|nr:MAG: peptidyl-prolyl cis-trans isomerase [Bacteroidia bacterium]
MKKTSFYALCLIPLFHIAQNNDPIVMKVGGKPITKSEFEALYHKNNNKTIDKKTVDDYAQMFALYKMKVFEAEANGLDTTPQFLNEFNNYKKQLAAPYLNDKNTSEKILEEAYDRLKYEVKAGHILIRCKEDDLPKDTLEAWTRANIIRNALLGKLPTPKEIAEYDKLLRRSTYIESDFRKKDSAAYKAKLNSVKNLSKYIKEAGDDKFTSIAPKTSDDPSVLDNHGILGWFTAFDMVYPFETAAYTTKPGEIAPLTRTKYGYHIVKVYDKRPARGEIQVAHIMVKFPKDATPQDKENAHKKIMEIHEKLKKNETDFDAAVKMYSDDEQSKNRRGLLPPFKSGRYPEPFENAAFALQKDGDISEPIETPYGWHIIRRVGLKLLPPYETIKNELRAKVQKDQRNFAGKAALIAQIKKECNFTENLKNRDQLLKYLDSTYLNATWKAEKAKPIENLELIKLCNKTFTIKDFAQYLESQMIVRSPTELKGLMHNLYAKWKDKAIIDFEESRLPEKYPEYKQLVNEYRDGILLFDITDREVWSKAVKDTAGLRKFYEQNKTKYMWKERADVKIYKCADEKTAAEVRKLLNKNKTEKEIHEAFAKKNPMLITSYSTTLFKGENATADKYWKPGIVPENHKDEDKERPYSIIVINKIIPETPKTLLEAKGQVTADYQNYLETEWINYLKKKYPVEINQDVLKTIQ